MGVNAIQVRGREQKMIQLTEFVRRKTGGEQNGKVWWRTGAAPDDALLYAGFAPSSKSGDYAGIKRFTGGIGAPSRCFFIVPLPEEEMAFRWLN